MQDIWNKDPAVWNEAPLHVQIEAMRIWHCTGACGQSSSVMGTRSALDDILRRAANSIEKSQEAIEASEAKYRLLKLDLSNICDMVVMDRFDEGCQRRAFLDLASRVMDA